MKMHSVVTLLCATILSFSAPATHACTCTAFPSLENTLNRERGTVFRGKVIQELSDESAPDEIVNITPKEYLVQVVLPYKGSPFRRNDHVVVSTAPSESLCGVSGIEEGGEFLFSGQAEPMDEVVDNIKVSTLVSVFLCSYNVDWSSVSNSERLQLWHYPTTPQEQLNNARSKWLNFQNYDYVYEIIGLLPPDIRATKFVQVRDGKVDSVTFEETGEEYDNSSFPVDTVAELFDTIQRAIDKDAHDIDVSYHNVYGYPTSLFIDYREDTVDEELMVTISELVVLSD